MNDCGLSNADRRSASIRGFHMPLAEDDQHWFTLIRGGDSGKVTNFLRAHPDYPVNIEDDEGHTALVVSVRCGHLGVVQVLLDTCPNLAPGDAVMHAVDTGDLHILELLLNRRRRTQPYAELLGFDQSADYQAHITPLMLACHQNNGRVVHYLINAGHVIKRPHPPRCQCKVVCKVQRRTSPLARLDTYRALASPAYIYHSAQDPILYCCKLVVELEECGEVERELVEEYRKLVAEVRRLPTQLLAQCHTGEEVEMLLIQTEGLERNMATTLSFPRVQLLIDSQMKDFLAHTHCQHVLTSYWLDTGSRWKTYPAWKKVVVGFLPRVLFLPIYVLIYTLAPNSKWSHQQRSPFSKFLNYMASYISFLIALFIFNYTYHPSQVRGPPTTFLAWFIIAYTQGLALMAFKKFIFQGMKRYIHAYWNWFDIILCVNVLFVCFFWLMAYLDVRHYGHKHLARKYWSAYDPTLIAEALFALVTVQAFGRLFFMCRVQEVLGPIQVSLVYMCKDIGIFLCLFLCVIFAFSTGLLDIYEYYKDDIQIDKFGNKHPQDPSFVSFSSTFRALFYALFTMTPQEFALLRLNTTDTWSENSTTHVEQHYVTQGITYTLFALWQFLSTIIFLNMLIAMMANSFQKVIDNADTEWKFTRTEVWMTYLVRGGTLPPPYNLIPGTKQLHALVGTILTCVRKARQRLAGQGTGWDKVEDGEVEDGVHDEIAVKCSMEDCCFLPKYRRLEKVARDEQAYQQLILTLIKRHMVMAGGNI